MAASPPLATAAASASAAAAASSNNTQAAVPFEVLLNGSAGASASAADIARRERRCRKLEREANEVKDVIWTLNHTVHILENIKHLSRDYIRQLFQLLDATMDESKSDQISVLHQAIGFLETSLKQWEHRYNAITGYSDTFSSSDSNNNNNNHHNSANNSAQQSSSEHQAEEEGEELDGEEEEDDEDEMYEIDDEAANGRNYGRVAGGTMPFELCEVSMATADDNNGDHNNGGEEEDEEDEDDDDLENSTFSDNTATSAGEQDHYGSNGGGGNFNSTSAAASTLKHRKRKYQTQFQQLNLNQLNNSYIANHSLPLVLHCDHPGCSYQTGARRQLAMHKRSHDGEVLYTCDVPGCGYLSNYKGNIKVHKKHRHRIDTTAKGRRQQQQQHHQQQNLTIQGQKRKIELYHSSPQPAPAKVRVEEDFGESSGRGYLGNRAVVQLQHDESVNNTSGTESAARDSNHNQAFGGGGGAGQALHRCVVEGCDYSSKWKQCLIAHQLQHAGVKPYKCDYPGCHYSTNFKGNVNVHKRVHRESPSTMYECSFAGCGFVTPWKNSILVHQSKHQQQARVAASTAHNKPLPV